MMICGPRWPPWRGGRCNFHRLAPAPLFYSRRSPVIRENIIELFRVPDGKVFHLKDYNPGWSQTEEMEELGKDEIKERARRALEQNLADLAQAQDLLYADDRYSVLIVLQAM